MVRRYLDNVKHAFFRSKHSQTMQIFMVTGEIQEAVSSQEMGAIGIVFKVKHLIKDTNIAIHHKFLETKDQIKKIETIQIKMEETAKTNTLAL